MCIFLYLSYVIFECPEEDVVSVENLTLNLSSIVGRFYFFCALILILIICIMLYNVIDTAVI